MNIIIVKNQGGGTDGEDFRLDYLLLFVSWKRRITTRGGFRGAI